MVTSHAKSPEMVFSVTAAAAPSTVTDEGFAGRRRIMGASQVTVMLSPLTSSLDSLLAFQNLAMRLVDVK